MWIYERDLDKQRVSQEEVVSGVMHESHWTNLCSWNSVVTKVKIKQIKEFPNLSYQTGVRFIRYMTTSSFRGKVTLLRGCIQKLPDWADNEINNNNNNNNNNMQSLRSNTKGYGGKTH